MVQWAAMNARPKPASPRQRQQALASAQAAANAQPKPVSPQTAATGASHPVAAHSTTASATVAGVRGLGPPGQHCEPRQAAARRRAGFSGGKERRPKPVSPQVVPTGASHCRGGSGGSGPRTSTTNHGEAAKGGEQPSASTRTC